MNDQNEPAQLRFLEETAIRLRQNGFTVEPIEDHHLPVCWEKGRLCRITGKGSVLYRQENVDSIRAQDALQVVIDTATGELWGMGHDKFDTICEQNINYFTSGSSCLSVLYAIPHEGAEGHESALWMATRDWLNSICCIYFRYLGSDIVAYIYLGRFSWYLGRYPHSN